MCGRYAATKSVQDLAEEFDAIPMRTQSGTASSADVPETIQPDYNVAPTKQVPAIVARPPRGEPDGEIARRVTVLRWGLVPFWAKDPSIGNRMINARMETVAEKPSFRKAFESRRALLPADGYFEWYASSQLGKNNKPLKQPFFIRPADGSTLAMAGLYEIWRDKSRDDDDPEAFRWTCTVLTTTAEDDLGHIHDRMPLLVERDRWDAWLDPTTQDKDALLSLLVPAAPGRLEAFPVSTDVNNVRNNGPSLIQPIQAEETLPLDQP